MAADPMTSAVDLIRSYGSVAVAGAGLSMSSYPMTAQLPAMLAHAFDLCPEERRELADGLGQADGPAKGLLVDETSMIAGWEIAHRLGPVRDAYQHAVARHDLDREPGPAHKALARMIHAGFVRYLISFNWDTAVERAYEQYFGKPLPDGVLVKPHGDASRPDQPWILPFQDEVIPDQVVDRMAELRDAGPHALLIIGYSGSDPVVLRDLLDPVSEVWPTRRISPSAGGDEGIAAAADDALPDLADALGAQAEVPGWLWVNYNRKRDLGAALLGHKLGPQDVDACPQVPAVSAAARNLSAAGFAVISGDSGGGKSLAAFQAGRILNRDGWGVLELASQGVASVDEVRRFTEVPGPVVAVVDDAQALDPSVRSAFERAVDGGHAVLMVSTQWSEHPAHSTIRPAQAVAAIKQFCLDNESDVAPLVSALDDRVGRRMMDERFERRVAASGFAKMPWEFMFTLGGGERRVSDAIEDLADTDDGPLLLGLVAVTEILSLDVGVGVDRLAELAFEVGHDRAWTEQTLEILVGRRLASVRDGRVRTPHIRLAQRALQVLCWDTDGEHWERFADVIARRFADSSESMEGRQWLSSMLSNSESNRRHRSRLLPDQVALGLVQEAATAGPGRDRRIAGSMMWEVRWWRAATDEIEELIAQALISWLPEMTADDAHGVHKAYSALRTDARKGRVSASISPEQLAHIVSTHVDVALGHEWGWLLGWLAHAEGVDTDDWRTRFAGALDIESLIGRVLDDVGDKIAGAVDFTHSLSDLAPAASAACIRALSSPVAHLIETNLPEASHALIDWCFGELLIAAEILDRPDPYPDDDLDEDLNEGEGEGSTNWAEETGWLELAHAIDELFESVNWPTAGASIAATSSDLEDLAQLDVTGFCISRLAPDAWSAATAAVDLDHLDRLSEGDWKTADRVARHVLTLTLGTDPTPGRSWARRHKDELEQVPADLAIADPELAVEVHSTGRPIRLGGPSFWDRSARVVDALGTVDVAVAKAVLRAHEDEIRSVLAGGKKQLSDGLVAFVKAVDRLDADHLDALIRTMDIPALRASWSDQASADPPSRTAAFLLERTAHLA